MAAERKELIMKLIFEQTYREDVRREIISQGFSSEGFEEEYDSMLNLMGLEEPMRKKIRLRPRKDIRGMEFELTKRQLQLSVVSVIALVALLSGAAFYFLDKGAPQEEIRWGDPSYREEALAGGTEIDDVFSKSKVESTVVSAKLYRGRMGTYDGVCDDITVVEPVKCLGTDESFVIFAPLSQGGFYCVDNSTFSGVTARPTAKSCS